MQYRRQKRPARVESFRTKHSGIRKWQRTELHRLQKCIVVVVPTLFSCLQDSETTCRNDKALCHSFEEKKTAEGW